MNRKAWFLIPLLVACAGLTPAWGQIADAPIDYSLNESELIATISSDAGWEAKQGACRGLRRVGTVAAVPALSALLTDETLSHMARYALEPMDIPEAGQALRDALAKTSGMTKVGVITSIGVREDAKAVPLLTPLLKDSDAQVAATAAGALGRIATEDAVAALSKGFGPAKAEAKAAIAEGLLAAGERLLEKGDNSAAAAIYEQLYSSKGAMNVRMGAFRGLAYAEPGKAADRLIEALGGKMGKFRGLAAQIIAETEGEADTLRYAEALETLPPAGQKSLLRGLADRGDAAARPAVLKAARKRAPLVKIAAINALASLGSPANVPFLAKLTVNENADVATAAKTSLIVLQGDKADDAIAKAVAEAEPAVKAELLAALMNRQSKRAVPTAVENVNNADDTVAVAALNTIGPLGGLDEAPLTIAKLGAESSAVRAAAEKALGSIASRLGDEVLPVMTAKMRDADEGERAAMVRVLARVGTTGALTAAVNALDDPSQAVGDEAVRVISNWQNMDALPALEKLAASEALNRQVLGMRGYVRLVQSVEDKAQQEAMLNKAMEMAKRPEEKRLVVAVWGTIASQASLDKLTACLNDADIREEAARAILEVSKTWGRRGTGPLKAALQQVAEKSKDAEIKQGAKEALGELK